METKEIDKCSFCGLNVKTSKHHIVPKCKNGNVTTPTCETCESFIHRTWSHNELRDTYDTVESIYKTEQFQKFLKWRRKQDRTAIFRSDRNNNRQSGRYR